MKYKVLFSVKDNEKVFIHAVCCSRDWRFKGKEFVTGINNINNFNMYFDWIFFMYFVGAFYLC